MRAYLRGFPGVGESVGEVDDPGAGEAAGADFAGADFDGAGCARAATILAVAALLIWQLRS